jgi:glycosyltransferase involved in cell wall biosynthesis
MSQAGSGRGTAAPEVSVVMAVFNGERYLREAVESILGQTLGDLELIVVDDGSTDRTPTILQEYRRADSRVNVLSQSNAGQPAALNRGCAVARGAYIARIDADDTAARERLSRQVAFLRRSGRVGLLGGSVDLINSRGRRFDRTECPLGDREIRRALGERNCFAHTTVMFRTEAWRVTGGYREAFFYAEDYDLWLRIAERYEVANLPESLARYRIHGDQVTVHHLRQHVVSLVGARLAARMRRAGVADPFCTVERITAETLGGYGVTEEEIDREMRMSALWWVRLLLGAGREEAAVALYRDVWGATAAGEPDRAVLGSLYWDQAREYHWQGRLAASIRTVLRALHNQPEFATRVARSLIRQIAGAGGPLARRLR